MKYLEVGRIYSIPAFLGSFVTGSIYMGLAIGLWAADKAEDLIFVFLAPINILIWSPIFIPVAAIVFFPVFFLLSIVHKLSVYYLCISGALAGLILNFLLEPLGTPFDYWPPFTFAIGGFVGGYTTYRILSYFAKKEVQSTNKVVHDDE